VTYFAWSDPDRKKPPAQKAADAIARYRDKHGADPGVLFCHPDDARALDGDALLCLVGADRFEVRASPSIPRSTFYLGGEEGE
jgi:hypothetical protein